MTIQSQRRAAVLSQALKSQRRNSIPWIAILLVLVLFGSIGAYVLLKDKEKKDANRDLATGIRSELSAERQLTEAEIARLNRWKKAVDEDLFYLADDCASCAGLGIQALRRPNQIGAEIIVCPLCKGDGLSKEAKVAEWRAKNPEQSREMDAKWEEMKKAIKAGSRDRVMKIAGYCDACNGSGVVPQQVNGERTGVECRKCGGRGRFQD